MRSARIHLVTEDELADYAEMPSFDWVERTNDYLREDEHWSIKLAVVCFFVWLGCALWPWVARVMR